MCFSVIRFKRQVVTMGQSIPDRAESEPQYAGMIDVTQETAYIAKLRADPLVTEFETYRFHDGEKRVERWEKTGNGGTFAVAADAVQKA